MAVLELTLVFCVRAVCSLRAFPLQLHHADQNMKTAKQQCLKNKSLGARCIFGEPKE